MLNRGHLKHRTGHWVMTLNQARQAAAPALKPGNMATPLKRTVRAKAGRDVVTSGGVISRRRDPARRATGRFAPRRLPAGRAVLPPAARSNARSPLGRTAPARGPPAC